MTRHDSLARLLDLADAARLHGDSELAAAVCFLVAAFRLRLPWGARERAPRLSLPRKTQS